MLSILFLDEGAKIRMLAVFEYHVYLFVLNEGVEVAHNKRTI